MKGVAPKGIDIKTIYKGVLPFIALQAIGEAAVFYNPELVTWLPEVAYGK